MIDRMGRQIGNYRLLRLLGQGAFADVYLGEHRYLKNYAALKLVRTALSDEQVESFLAEAQILARLAHPRIVRVLDFLVEQGTPVLVMDYAPGGTVRQSYPMGSRLPLEKTVTYVEQVAIALQYAHNRNVIHRDVKPENMLLGSQQDLLLSDFGLSLFAPSPQLMSTQATAGTLPYVAPEQLQGKPCFASDQYSLGIVVYEWLCGRRPFTGSSWDLIQQHMSTPPPPLREFSPELPPEVEFVVLRALAKDPQQRFVSVQAFAHALSSAASQSLDADLDREAEVTAPLGKDSRPSSGPPYYDTSQRIFLSATPADDAFAVRLHADLQRRGILVHYDHPETATQQKEEVVRQAIRDAQLVVLVLSSHARSSRIIKEHIRIANMYEQRMVFVWAQGSEMSEVFPASDEWEKTSVIDIIDAREAAYTYALEKLVAHLEYETAFINPPGHALAEPAGEPRNPYKGLRAFTTDEAADFFGRDALVHELLEELRTIITPDPLGAPASRLLTVIGPSGSGKSSVMMAGLLPQLQVGALPGSQDWIYLKPMVPGQRPLESLALTLAGLLPERSMKSIREDLEDDSARGLHLLATQVLQRAAAKAANSRVVLVIDQFEELFTQTLTEDERRRFLDLLIAAVTEPRGPVVALITLRADFSDRPMHYPALFRLVELHSKSVLPMNIQDLRAVIERPASLPDVQLTFEGDLLGDLLFESYNQIGILPLLEFTLDQLFQLREGHRLTLQAYQQVGGVKGALAKQAEATYNSLPSEEHRRLARILFLRLIAPNLTEQVATRRRAPLSELSLPDAKQTATIHQVLDAFVAARLLTTDEFAGTTTVEISHEALIRAWSRLSDWLREDSEDLHQQQIISADAIEWERRGKPKDRLYRGSQLSEASTWARRNMPNQNEQAFLSASLAQQRRSRLNVVAVVLLLILTAGLLFQFAQSQLTPATVVMNTQDAGPGSLRQIIDHAPSGSTITVRAGLKGIITLTNGDLDIKQPLTIIGPGPDALIISSGTRGYRVKIEPVAVVSISGVSFQNSKNLTSGFIYNGGNLTLTNSHVSGNSSGDLDSRAGFGGGISNFGVLTISHSLISGNKATRQGGGISNYGLLSLTDTIISGNSTTGDGGGIYTDSSGSLSLTNSSVSGNTANGDGGGIASNGFFSGGPLSLTKSTISGNTAAGNGGGISNYGQLSLTNSTISDNRAAHNGGGIFDGGTTSQANLSFCTLYGNGATGQGGAIFQESPTPSSDTQVTACIVAGNSAAINAGIAGILTSNGYNLLQNMADLSFTATGLSSTDRSVQDTDLTRIFSAPVQLRNNGGSTQTYALSPNVANPAFDKVPLTLCQLDGMSTDQRMIKRPDGNEQFCDIGAYEAVD